MRFYLYSAECAHLEWFTFLDDDVYIRPFAFTSMLQGFKLNTLNGSIASTSLRDDASLRMVFALVSTRAYRSFQFSKAWIKTGSHCNDSRLHNFPVAMPAVLTRQAMQTLRAAIDANGLLRLQRHWGGSGDAVLGLLLWVYEMPIYSFSDAYIEAKASSNRFSLRPFNASQVIVVHSAKNMKNLRSRVGRHLALPSHLDVARYLGDIPFADLTSNVLHTHLTHIASALYQSQMGTIMAKKIFRMNLGNVAATLFKVKAPDVRAVYRDFEVADCAKAETTL